jgi:hypothetical protein
MPLFGSPAPLTFTVYSTNPDIISSPKVTDTFDIFSYSPPNTKSKDETKPNWFSMGTFKTLKGGEEFTGAFEDVSKNRRIFFQGIFDHAVFYAPESSKTQRNDIAVTFKLLAISDKPDIIKNTIDETLVPNIEYRSFGKDTNNNNKLTFIKKGIDKNNVTNSDDKNTSEDTSKNKPKCEYIINNLLISSEPGKLYGTVTTPDQYFLKSLIPNAIATNNNSTQNQGQGQGEGQGQGQDQPQGQNQGQGKGQGEGDGQGPDQNQPEGQGQGPDQNQSQGQGQGQGRNQGPDQSQGQGQGQGQGQNQNQSQIGGRKRKTGKKRKSRRRATKRKFRTKNQK